MLSDVHVIERDEDTRGLYWRQHSRWKSASKPAMKCHVFIYFLFEKTRSKQKGWPWSSNLGDSAARRSSMGSHTCHGRDVLSSLLILKPTSIDHRRMCTQPSTPSSIINIKMHKYINHIYSYLIILVFIYKIWKSMIMNS